MSTSSDRDTIFSELTLDSRMLSRAAINGVRVAFGISGVAALILGIVLLVHPSRTLAAIAVVFGIYFIIAGLVRLGVGVFSRSISAGLRVLDILFGLLLVGAGVIAVKDSATAAAVLLIVVTVIIGIGWIIEGVLSIVESKGAPSSAWAIVFGVLSIIAGLIVLAVPGWSVLWLVLVGAISLIVLGILGIVRAFVFGRAARS